MDAATKRAQHAEYMRGWRALNPEKIRAIEERYKLKHGGRTTTAEVMRRGRKAWELRNRVKYLAHRAVDNLVNHYGFIKPDSCSVCGVPCETEAHHTDYLKRLDVIWMCRGCHRQQHREEKV
jgi:hypothetical protein